MLGLESVGCMKGMYKILCIIYHIDKQLIERSKKSPTGPTEQTPKPEYLVALAPTYLVRGPLGFGPIQFLMEKMISIRG